MFKPGPSTHAEAAELNQIAKAVAALRRLKVTAPLELKWMDGQPVLSAPGLAAGFEAELTGAWNATTGYPWKRLNVDGVAFAAEAGATGNGAISFVEDTTLTSGVQGWMVPYQGKYVFIHGDDAGAGGGGCPGKFDWLRDTDSLTFSDAEASPPVYPRILTLTSLEGLGRCACIGSACGLNLIHQPGTSPPEWRSFGRLPTCCGTADVTLVIDKATAVADHNPHALAYATLTVHKGCDDADSTTVTFLVLCGDDGTVTLSGVDNSICDPVTAETIACTNVVRITLECGECELGGESDCPHCNNGVAAGSWQVPVTGFEDDAAPLNGKWTLSKAPDEPVECECAWTYTCGGITVTFVIGPEDYTLTFSGDQSAVYSNAYTPGELDCLSPLTVNKVSGPSPGPASLVLYPADCEGVHEDGVGLHVPCCVGVTLPTSVLLSFVYTGSGEPVPWCATQTIEATLAWDADAGSGGTGAWVGTITFPDDPTNPGGSDPCTYDVELEPCVGDAQVEPIQSVTLVLSQGGNPAYTNNAGGLTCDPFEIEFVDAPTICECSSTAEYTGNFVVSEAPGAGGTFWCVVQANGDRACVESETQPEEPEGGAVYGPYATSERCGVVCPCMPPLPEGEGMAMMAEGAGEPQAFALSAVSAPVEAVATPPRPRRMPLALRPPCSHEGPVVEACKSCGDKEGRHVRACYEPSGTIDKCVRGPSKNPVVQSCLTCERYQGDAPLTAPPR